MSANDDPVPLAPLLVMALMGFILIATETMPAGLLPQIGAGLGVTEGTAGQLVSAYALGTVLATIPAIAYTQQRRRKPVFLAGILGFVLATTVTALSTSIVLSLVARFVAGAFSGMIWGLLAGYARRITPAAHAGRALAIASVGVPLGLAIGTPFGSWIGTTFDWRWSFAGLASLGALVLVLTLILVPDAPGQRVSARMPLLQVSRLPGVPTILLVIFVWMLAHNAVYTYFATYLRAAAVPLPIDRALVTLGLAAVGGIWITGVVIDRALRPLVLCSIAAFSVAGVLLSLAAPSQLTVLAAIVLWGLAFGGASAQLQTAIGDASGENADVANSMLAVSFNLAIFAAGVMGAVVVDRLGGRALPFVLIGLPIVAFVLVLVSRRSAFPARQEAGGPSAAAPHA